VLPSAAFFLIHHIIILCHLVIMQQYGFWVDCQLTDGLHVYILYQRSSIILSC